MLVSSNKILDKARKEGYAVPQFNIGTLEALLAVISSAEKMSASVIIGTSEGEIKHSSEKYIASMVKVAAEANVDVALHLDHGSSLKQVKKMYRCRLYIRSYRCFRIGI